MELKLNLPILSYIEGVAYVIIVLYFFSWNKTYFSRVVFGLFRGLLGELKISLL